MADSERFEPGTIVFPYWCRESPRVIISASVVLSVIDDRDCIMLQQRSMSTRSYYGDSESLSPEGVTRCSR